MTDQARHETREARAVRKQVAEEIAARDPGLQAQPGGGMSADIWFEGNHTHCQHGGHNVTYNLTPMLKEAGFVGHKETIGWGARKYGRHLLRVYLRLANDPDSFKALNPENGWGTYDGLVEWTLETGICASLQPKRAIVGGWL